LLRISASIALLPLCVFHRRPETCLTQPELNDKLAHTVSHTTIYSTLSCTLNLLTSTIIAPPSNASKASKWQIGFNSAFKRRIKSYLPFARQERVVYRGV
jgi:hypothetical protein